jgi:hypothetical protein
VWCNRIPPRGTGGGESGPEILELTAGGEVHRALACPGHRQPAARFFAWVAAGRYAFGAGIFLPLLLLLGALAAASLGERGPLPAATALFQLAVGITVNAAALGPLLGRAAATPVAVPFPLHNFFLLGVRTLLWIFRLVGIWWLWQGAGYFLR